MKNKINFIRKNKDKISWFCLSYKSKLSEEIIEEFQDNVDWYNICKYQKLSEKFMTKFSHKLIWWIISKYQTLSEEFILCNKNLIDWNYICENQYLSENSILENKEVISPIMLSNNIKIKFYNYKLIYLFKPDLNDKFVNLVKIRIIQRWWVKIMLKPNGFLFNKAKSNFNYNQYFLDN